MDCRDVQQLCNQWLDHALPPEQSRALERHCADCPSCARHTAAQRKAHDSLSKAVTESGRRLMPSDLQSRLQARLRETEAPAAVPLPSVSTRVVRVGSWRWYSLGGLTGTAALLAIAVTLYTASTPGTFETPAASSAASTPAARATPTDSTELPEAILKKLLAGNGPERVQVSGKEPCRWLRFAGSEALQIETGQRSPLATSQDIATLTRLVSARIDKGVVPSLERCRMRPRAVGDVKIPDCSGVFVSYACDVDASRCMTLLVLNTPASPRGIQVKELLAARCDSHQILSWHPTPNGPLYMLISHMSFKDTLELAEVASEQTRLAYRN